MNVGIVVVLCCVALGCDSAAIAPDANQIVLGSDAGAGASGSCPKEDSFFSQPTATSAGATYSQATRLSLDAYCGGSAGACPPTLEDALATHAAALRIRGCGVDVLETRPFDLGGTLWAYDGATGALIGASTYDDVPRSLGGCSDHAFQAGEGPPVPPPYGGGTTHRSTCSDIQTDNL